MINENFVPQGWQCPICNRVYSPATPMCYYCGDNSVTITSTGTGSIPMPVDPSTTGVKPQPNYSVTIGDANHSTADNLTSASDTKIQFHSSLGEIAVNEESIAAAREYFQKKSED